MQGGKILKVKMKQWIRQISIEKRLGYAFFVLSLIPIISVGTLAITVSRKTVLEKSEQYIVQLVETLEDKIENNLRTYERLINELMVSSSVQRLFRDDPAATYLEKVHMKNNVNDVFISKLSSYPYIRDVKLINLENQVIHQRGYLLNDESHIEEMVRQITSLEGGIRCFSQSIYDEDYIILAKKINSVYTQSEVGFIVFVLKQDAIKSVYERLDFGDGANSYLVDEKNTVILTQYEDTTQIKVQELMGAYKEGQKKAQDVIQYRQDYKDYRVIGKTIDRFGCHTLTIVPNEHFLREIDGIQHKIIAIIFICFVVSFAVSKMITHSITEPLKKLQTYIESAIEEKFEKPYKDESRDELGRLGRDYERMNKEMKHLITTIEKTEKEKREMELSMLQAQINPHFLFNTLNSLRWIAMINGAKNIEEGILSLAELLKNTIIYQSPLISIEEEINNLKHYIFIQRLRYGESFGVIWMLEDPLMKYKIPKLMLQPIMENAILHGLREDEHYLTITVRLKEEELGLCIEIEDDGRGFNLDQRDKEQMTRGLSGIGMKNVEERIKLHFGEGYKMTIKSVVDKGTLVKIHIPKIEVT